MQKHLLHACCAICAAGALHNRLITDGLGDGATISLYYYNPNINTKEEYLKRANELQKLREVFVIDKIYIEDYNLKLFNTCENCITHRLQKTAEFTIQNNYNTFGTVLSTSPHKNADFINATGASIATDYKGATYLPANFKKQNGFIKANQISKQLNLYRQNYCGCGADNR